ncbi:VWA domain-containing protein [Streptomyces sp. NPDC020801]|uniref:VWA domain-containing protein n=1 Tax=Streptomyces sp. NPDC020801 TaxID=3365093 RepID=UPI00379C71C1
MNLFRKTTTAPVPSASGKGPAISFDKVPSGLVNLTKTAAVSLEKKGLTGQRSAVYLVVDRSYSMAPFYRDGSVQLLAEQALGLSANLDDDGRVPLLMFDSRPYDFTEVSLDSYAGIVGQWHALNGGEDTMAGTRYAPAIDAVVQHYQRSQARDPAFVIFQTDGDPQDRPIVEQRLKEVSNLPLFWSFVGFGHNINFLKRLDNLRGRTVDNASFFHAANPRSLSDTDLYDGLTHEYGSWLADATAAGVIR